MIRFPCSCSKVIEVEDWRAGQRVPCPECGALATVPTPEGLPAEDAPPAARPAPAAEKPKPGKPPLAARYAAGEAPAPAQEPVMKIGFNQGAIDSPPGEARPGPAPGLPTRPARRGSSPLGITALVCSFCGWVPIFPLYFFSVIGLVLGITELILYKTRPHGSHSRSLGIASILVALLPLLLILLGLLLIALLVAVFGGAGSGGGGKGSCPLVFSHDGSAWCMDADPVSGALFEAGERVDRDRLESLVAVDGTYRLKVVNAIDRRDGLNEVALEVVDHAPGEEAVPLAGGEAVPLAGGEVVRAAGAVTASACRDQAGRDLLEVVRDADERAWSGEAGDFVDDSSGLPRLSLDLAFPRPAGEGRLLLLLRARNTRFAADSFSGYMSRMGSVALALMHQAEDCEDYPFQEMLSDEMDRAGLRLAVSEGREGASGLVARVDPVGPAVLRTFAVPLPEGARADGAVHVRLEWSPLLWEVDQARLGRESGPAGVTVLRPRRAQGPDGGDPAASLAEADDARVYLAPGESVEVEYDAPAPLPAGRVRTVTLRLRGWYILETEGYRFFDPIAFVQHHAGWDSLPRFALRRAREMEAAR